MASKCDCVNYISNVLANTRWVVKGFCLSSPVRFKSGDVKGSCLSRLFLVLAYRHATGGKTNEQKTRRLLGYVDMRLF